MHKVKALYINEMIKYSKKVSVIVILAIMTLGVIGYGAVLKLTEVSTGTFQNPAGNESEMLQQQLDYFRTEIIAIEKRIEQASDEELTALLNEKYFMESEISRLELAIEYDIPLYSSSDYRVQLLAEIARQKSLRQNLASIPADDRTPQQQAQIAAIDRLTGQLLDSVKSSNFRAYIDLLIDQANLDSTLSAEEKTIKVENLELWYLADPSGGLDGKTDNNIIQNALSQVETYKLSLLKNLDYTAGSSVVYPLTPAGRAEITDQLAVLEYRLRNGFNVNNNLNFNYADMASRGMMSFGLFMIVLLTMILAGGSVSQEIATGSIKSLIIAPVKRWKIFTAKVLSLLSMSIAAVIFLYFLSMAVRGFLFGFLSGEPYVYAVNGQAGELNYYIFMLGYLLADFIDIIVYMALAMMLSVITRNTALSVGVSVGVYFVGSFVVQALAVLDLMGQRGEWVKFIPFSNLALAADLFPYDNYMNIFNAIGGYGIKPETPSALFSLIYLTVLVICLGYTTLDSFVRRDIK